MNTSFPSHFFAHCKGVHDYKYNFGMYQIVNHKAKKNSTTNDIEDWKSQILESYQALPVEKQNILFYIHGLWADNKHFVALSTGILQEQVFSDSLNNYGLIISLQWEAGIKYSKNYTIAQEKGAQFADLVLDVINILNVNCDKTKISFLNHSMGNIVFTNLTNTILQKNTSFQFYHAYLMAADLPCDIFENELKETSNHFSKIWVFYNLDDKTLQVANALKAQKRLGIYGPLNHLLCPKNLILRDTTGLKDNESLTSKMTLHRYFYASPSIRKELRALLAM